MEGAIKKEKKMRKLLPDVFAQKGLNTRPLGWTPPEFVSGGKGQNCFLQIAVEAVNTGSP
jgi:hypothetical protein